MTSEPPAGALYWQENYPLLLVSLADMTPGIQPGEVAELLAILEEELVKQAEPGTCMDFSDNALVKLYMNELLSQ